jgi:organic hydroperoxide reductase OsmC/OhrA
VPASASPQSCRSRSTPEDAVDPEEALVASLSSCHMLTFLDLARRAGFVVDSYEDEAIGRWRRTPPAAVGVDGDAAAAIAWGGKQPAADELDRSTTPPTTTASSPIP